MPVLLVLVTLIVVLIDCLRAGENGLPASERYRQLLEEKGK